MRLGLVAFVVMALGTAGWAQSSMKGWELYYRKAGAKDAKSFGLLVGTNRLKSREEIRGALTIGTWAELETRLRRLTAGDILIVQDELSGADRKKLAEIVRKASLKLQ